MLNSNPLKKFHKSVKPKLKLCPTKKRAVAWTQSFLEPVYRRRGVRDPSCPAPRKRVSQNRCGEHERK
jgi:hypothetical protein